MCIGLAWEAREGPNTQGQAGRSCTDVPMLTAITTDGSKVQGFPAKALRTDPTTVNTQWGAQHDCMLDSTVYLCGSVVNNKAPQQWYSTESLMMSAVNGTTVSHITVLDAGVTDIDVGFYLLMSQGIAVSIRTGSGNVARCDPVSCVRRCVVGCYTKDCESLTL